MLRALGALMERVNVENEQYPFGFLGERGKAVRTGKVLVFERDGCGSKNCAYGSAARKSA